MYDVEETYWGGEGKYQFLSDILYEYFVPAKGECEIDYMEAYRMASRVYYDYFNNGGCNLDNYYYREILVDNSELKEKFDDESLYDDYVRILSKVVNAHTNPQGMGYMDDICSEVQLQTFEVAQEAMMDATIEYVVDKGLKELAAIRNVAEE